MKRVTYDWKERLDTGLGSLFPIYFSGAIGFALFGRGLLVEYLLVGAVAFLFFVLLCPWIPGQRGLTKAVSINIPLAGALVVTEFLFTPGDSPIRKHLIIAMVAMPIYGGELGGMASTLRSDLDPFLARLGIGTVGKLSFAGAVRTELLNGYRELTCDRELCVGCRACVEICPQGAWDMDEHNRAVLARKTDCTACRACITQCSSGAIQARGPDEIHDRDSDRSTQPTGWSIPQSKP